MLKNVCFHPFSRYSMKVVKAAAQVLNTLWQYRDLRTIYKKVRTMTTTHDHIPILLHAYNKLEFEMTRKTCKYQRSRRLKNKQCLLTICVVIFPLQPI